MLFYRHTPIDTAISNYFVTIKLNTLTNVPYQLTVGVASVYVCENLVKRSR